MSVLVVGAGPTGLTLACGLLEGYALRENGVAREDVPRGPLRSLGRA